MGMTIHKRVNSTRTFNNGLEVVRCIPFPVSDMPHQDDIVRTLFTYFIDIFLNRID